MQVRHVVAAVQVVVDEHLPVAVEHIPPALDPLQRRQPKRRDARNQVGAEERVERSTGIDADENPRLPHADRQRHQPVRGAVEVAHAGEVGRPLELAAQRVGPPVIRAAQQVGGAFG